MGLYERIMENPIRNSYNILKKELHLNDFQMYKRFPDLTKEMERMELERFKLYSSLSTRLIFYQVEKEEKEEEKLKKQKK
jgi:hypothetical protein